MNGLSFYNNRKQAQQNAQNQFIDSYNAVQRGQGTQTDQQRVTNAWNAPVLAPIVSQIREQQRQQTPEFKPTKAPTLQEARQQKWDALPDWQKKQAKDLNPYNAAELNKERDTIDANLKNAQAIVNAVNGNPSKFAGNADAKQAYDWARDYLNGGAKLRDELSYMQTDEDYKKYLDSQQKTLDTYERRANLDLDKARKDLEELKAQKQTQFDERSAGATDYAKGWMKATQYMRSLTPELDAKIKELEDDIAYVERRKENEEKYRSLLKDPAFGKDSQYLSNGDLKYEYINGNQDAVYQRMNDNTAGTSVNPIAINEWNVGVNLGTAVTAAMDEWRIYQYMAPEEIAIYNALYKEDQLKPQQSGEKKPEGILDYLGWTGTKDIEGQYESKAEDYLKFLEPELNERARYAEMKQAREYAKEHPVLASGASVVMSPFKAYTYLTQAADVLSGQGLDQNAQSNAFSYMNTAIRDQVAKEISKNAGKNGEFAYQTAMSMADNLWQSFITGTMAAGLTKEGIAVAEHAMLAIMSAGAAADSVIAAKDRGLSDGQAFAIGTAAGAVEYATEKIGVDRLFASLENGESFAKAMLANALAEGGEEILGNGMNEVLDFIINGMDSERMQRIKELMDRGYTESQAAGIAFGEFGLETLKEGASGALSGAAFGAGTGAISYVSSSAYYASLANQAQKLSANALNPEGVAGGFDVNVEINKGLSAPKTSKAYKQAQIAQRQQSRSKSGKVNGVTYGQLIAENAAEVRDAYMTLQAMDRAGVLTDEERHKWEVLRDSGNIGLSSELSTWSGTNPFIWQVTTNAYSDLIKLYDKFTAEHKTEFEAWQKEQRNNILSAYTDAGLSYGSAEEISEIIDKLVRGEYVTETQIDRLHLNDPKYADVFYQITGVDVDPSQNIATQARQARSAIPPAELTSLEEAHNARLAAREAEMQRAQAELTPAPVVNENAAAATPAESTAIAVTSPQGTALVAQQGTAQGDTRVSAPGREYYTQSAPARQQTRREQNESRRRGVQRRISEITASREASRRQTETAQFRASALADRVFSARQDVAAAKKELADLKEDYNKTIRDMAGLEQRAERAERGAAKKLTKKEQADLYELQRHWEDDLADFDERVEKLEQKITDLEAKVNDAVTAWQEAVDNISVDEDFSQETLNEIRALNDELERLETELEEIEEEENRQREEAVQAAARLLELGDYLGEVVYDENGNALTYDEFVESIRNDPDSEGMTDDEIAEAFKQLVDAIAADDAERIRAYNSSTRDEQDALVKTLNARLGTGNEFHMADDTDLLDNPALVANGMWDDKTGNIYFSRDLTTQQMLQWVLAHELLHQAKSTTGSDIVDEVLDTMLRMNRQGLIDGRVKTWLDNYDEWFDQQAKMYRTVDANEYGDTARGRTNVREELAAQLMRLVLPQTKFWNNLSQVRMPLLLRLLSNVQTRSRANDPYTKALRRLTSKIENALYVTEEQKQARYEQGRNGVDEAENDGEEGEEKYSVTPIVAEDGTDYGFGVRLDSSLLDNLTDKERRQMVVLRVGELGGQSFTAYDDTDMPIEIQIASEDKYFRNKNGRRRRATHDLMYKNSNIPIKQEAVVLSDELIETARDPRYEPSKYPHDWLDANGQNPWAQWTTYLLDKNNTIWRATLSVSTASDGKHYLYDIGKIEKIGQASKLATSLSENNTTTPTTESQEPGAKKHSLSEDKRLEELVNLLDSGASPSVVYNQTGLAVLGNGSIVNPETQDIIGRYERGTSNEGRVLPVRESAERGALYRQSTGRDVAGYSESQSRGSLKDWNDLDEQQRERIVGLIAGYMSAARYEGQQLLSKIGSNEAFAERFYTMLEQGRVVAEQWANLIPDIQNLMDDIEAVDGVFESEETERKYSISPAMQAKLDAQLAKYGAQRQSSRDARDVKLPQQTNTYNRVSRTPRTVANAAATTDANVEDIQRMVVDGKLTYVPNSHKQMMRDAENWVKQQGWNEAVRLWTNAIKGGRVNSALVARGAVLLNNASNGGSSSEFMDLMTDYTALLRNAGQAVEAAKLYQELTPEGRLYQVQRVVDRMNEDLKREKLGFPDIVIPQTLIDAYNAAETDKARSEILTEMAKGVAAQLPTTNLDRWTALRYLNMLGNFKTQIRNLAGNATMQVVRFMKDTIAGAMDAVFNPNDRTTSLAIDLDSYKAGWDIFDAYEEAVINGGRYNDNIAVGFQSEVNENKQVFGKTKSNTWNKTIGTALEGYRKVTNWAMTEGDVIFCKLTFAESIGRFMAANRTTWSSASEELRARAINKAVRDAAEATYHDSNTLSNWVVSIARSSSTPKAIKILAEGVLPFRKTPANILVRAYEYSPLSLIENTVKTIQMERAKNGKAKEGSNAYEITGADIVNRWAKTLTGSTLVAVGFMLSALGLLTGKKSDDKDEAELEKQMGFKEYALKVGNKYLTVDWLAPASIPLFLGANLCQAAGDRGLSLKEAISSVTRIADPLVQMSMLQGVNDALENAATYGTDSALGSFLINATWGYFSQGLSNTLIGQLKRGSNNTRMQTYVDKNDWVPESVQRAIGKTSAKIPLWNYNQIPYINAWGETEQNADTAAGNVVYQLFSPGYITPIKKTEMLDELDRLYEATGDGGVVLDPADKSFNVGKEKLNLSADQYVVYAMTRGQTAQRVVSELIQTPEYKAMPDKEKVEAVKKAYGYANALAKNAVAEDYKLDSTYTEARRGYEEYNIPEATYFAAWSALKDITGYKNGKGDTVENSSSILKAEALDQRYPNLTKEQRDFLLEALGVGKTVRGWNKNLIAAKAKGLRNQYGG